MPKKSESTEKGPTPRVEIRGEDGEPFFFPTIGEGIMIFARDEQAARRIAESFLK